MHEVAQRITPSSRVVYADNDPLVLAHARALLTSTPEGRTAYISADLHDPEAILSAPETRDLLDFSQPIALLVVAVLHFVPDDEKPADILKTLLDALPSGSYFVSSHVSLEDNPEMVGAAVRTYREAGLPRPGPGFRRVRPAGVLRARTRAAGRGADAR